MKTADEIYQEMMAAYQARGGTAAEDSCDLAVRLYAAAAQVQALSAQADWVLNQSFPQTAAGESLDRHAEMRGITRASAAAAQGVIRFSVASAGTTDWAVESGTVCLTESGVRFETTARTVIPAGSLFADAPARASNPGVSGNVGAGTVTLFGGCPTGVTACTNPAAFSGGQDAEDDETLRARILDSYRRLPTGANAAYYEKTALSHAGVAAAKAVGRARGIGTVNVYLASSSGVPDAAVLEEVRSDLAARREIAVDVEALPPKTAAVNVAVELFPTEGVAFEDAKTAADAAVRGLFTGALLGKPVYLAELTRRIYSAAGVDNCRITAPSADLPASPDTLPVLGTLTITAPAG